MLVYSPLATEVEDQAAAARQQHQDNNSEAAALRQQRQGSSGKAVAARRRGSRQQGGVAAAVRPVDTSVEAHACMWQLPGSCQAATAIGEKDQAATAKAAMHKTIEIAEEGEAEAPCHAAPRKSQRMSKPSVKAAAMLPNVRYAAASVPSPQLYNSAYAPHHHIYAALYACITRVCITWDIGVCCYVSRCSITSML